MNKEGIEMVADLNLRIQQLEQEVKTLRNERNAVLDRNRELHISERTLKEEAEQYEKMIQQLYDHQEGPLLVGKVKLTES
jgi:regulator of replication initiation timing